MLRPLLLSLLACAVRAEAEKGFGAAGTSAVVVTDAEDFEADTSVAGLFLNDSGELAQKGPAGAFGPAGCATVGGALTALSANVLAWSAHYERMGHTTWTSSQNMGFFIVCLFGNLGGIAFFAYSCAMPGGAVATVMPIQTGANLLVNMLCQNLLGIKRFTKDMRVGTIVLVVTVAQLSDIGPEEPDDVDALKLLGKSYAVGWVGCMFAVTGLSLVTYYFTRKQGMASLPKFCSITLIVALLTVIGSSISKCFGLLHGAALYAAYLLYFVVGVVLMAFTLLANATCDVSLFIPAELSLQLVLNMITGFAVWEDHKYIKNMTAYLCVYVLCCLGVYLISPQVDLLSMLLKKYWVSQSRLSTGSTKTPFGEALVALRQKWGQEHRQDDHYKAKQEVVKAGLETGEVSQAELASLAMYLLEEDGPAPSAVFMHWLEEVDTFGLGYSVADPAMKDALIELLGPKERSRLAERRRRSSINISLPGMESPPNVVEPSSSNA